MEKRPPTTPLQFPKAIRVLYNSCAKVSSSSRVLITAAGINMYIYYNISDAGDKQSLAATRLYLDIYTDTQLYALHRYNNISYGQKFFRRLR